MAIKHEDVTDAFKHTPKNFDTASIGDSSFKNEKGLNEYFASEKLPDVLNVVDSMTAPPTEIDGNIYALTDVSDGLGRQQIDSINWINSNTVRITFNVGYNLTTVAINDYAYIQNSNKSLQNGRYLITNVTSASGYIEVVNVHISSPANDEAASPAYASFGFANWDGGTSGDWVRYNLASNKWLPIKLGNGSGLFNKTDSYNYFYRNSLLVVDLLKRTYNATITQSTTSAPVPIVIGKNEIGVLIWNRTAIGTYTATLNKAFTASKTLAFITNIGGGKTAEWHYTDANTMTLKTYDSTGVLKDSILTTATAVKIEIHF